MTIEHIQTIFSPEHGGPSESLRKFALGQAGRGVHVRVRVLEGFRDTSPAVRLDGAVDQQIFPVVFPRIAGRSPRLRRLLREESAPDVYHLHGVWHLGQRYARDEALCRRVPYVIEMMGGYQPEELKRKPWRKRLFRAWFQDDLLRRAACIHVNSLREMEQLQQLGFRGPFAPIPVGFDVAAAEALEARVDDDVPAFAADWPADRRFVLYLSRLHPNKGVEVLLDAWRRLAPEHPEVWLVIAGPGQPDYCATLAATAATGDRIRFLGFVNDRDRVWLYRHAAVYCLPSFSENYGATIQDALGHGTPVVTSRHTPWHDLETMGAGWLVEPQAKSLAEVLARALAVPAESRKEMGRRGRAWIRRDFSLGTVIDRQIELYTWLIGGPRPGFLLTT